ncbi:hypothetical protein [Pseudomonas sp. PS01303]|uniref:hypothetical protein n=1 Tax=Pseudomonas sp. PS01303 TaxID=2991439 RepID=UPI00249C7283|nr:hypothetical protein [Pseudomonas sp. PS01303]
MQHHRAKQRQKVTPTIKTEGRKIMSTQTPMQFAFSESEYRARCQNAKGFYESRIEKPSAGILGAIVEFNPRTLDESHELYHQYRAAGWLPLEPAGGLPTAMLIESPQASFITIYLKKPPHQQESDLVKVCKQIKAELEAELEAALNAEIDRQVAMSLAKDERDRLQAEQQQRLNREQEVRDDLAASRAKLREKLIKTGKLNTDGSAA